MCSGVLWKIIVTQHSLPLHQEMQLDIVLCNLGRHWLILRRNGAKVLWARSHLRWTEWQWETCLSWSDKSTFQLVFGKNGHRILRAKDEKDHPDCYQRKVQKPASVMVWGCISAHGMGDLHICEGTIDAEAYLGILERHMLPSRRRLFPGTPCLFQQDNARPHSAEVTTVWLRKLECVCLTGSPDLSPIQNVWRIMKRRIRQRWRPWTVEQLKSCIHQEWAKIPLAKLQQLIYFSSQTITKCN